MSSEAVKQAQERREIGMDRSIGKCGAEWKRYAIEFLEHYCRTHERVFVDDLWDAGLIEPESPRGLGAVMMHAKRAGWIVPLKHEGYVMARPSVHSNQQLKAVWRSRLFSAQPVKRHREHLRMAGRGAGVVADGPKCRGVGQGDLF